MEKLFKILGLFLVFLSATIFGFLKTLKLKKRVNKLSSLYCSMSNIREHIRTGTNEIPTLIKKTFPKNSVILTNNKYTISSADITNSDKKIIDEFLAEIGMADSKTEYQRIGLYMTLISQNQIQAENDLAKLGKLYSATGALIGALICIFLW